VVPSPNVGDSPASLFGAVALTSDDAWAVGTYVHVTGGSGYQRTVIEHWNGTAWSVVPSPDPSATGHNWLNSVTGRFPGDVWAVGYHDPQNTLVEHWDGGGWTAVSSPRIGGVDRWPSTQLQAATTTYKGNAWAVGYFTMPGNPEIVRTLIQRVCPIKVEDAGYFPQTVATKPGNTVIWKFSPDNSGSHSVSDGSGLGLFDSGSRPPGGSFSFGGWNAAGSYPVLDTSSGNTSQVTVPMSVSPKSGSSTTVFQVSWAANAPAPGHVFDVQIRRPGSKSFVGWRTGVTDTGGQFRPDAGAGFYSFRARMRNTNSGSALGWSPSLSVAIS
jgi:hypothetical protein